MMQDLELVVLFPFGCEGLGHSLESMSDGISHAPDRRRQAFYAHAPLLKALKRSQVGYIIAPSSFLARPLLLTS